MKRSTMLWAAMLMVQTGRCQKMPTDYFEEGAEFVRLKNYPKAISAYKYIVDHHKKNELYPESFYNLAYTYYLLKDYKAATQFFSAILTSNFNEKELIGGDIMASLYANYRHRASSLLYRIYDAQKKYDSSLYYLALSDSVYRYEHFCGNELAENEISLSLQYADLYQKLHNKPNAVYALLKTVFTDGIADNSPVLKTLRSLLVQQQRKGLKKELDAALLHLHAKEQKDSETSNAYYFTFLGTEVKAPYASDKNGFNKDEAISKIKSSKFYKLIASL